MFLKKKISFYQRFDVKLTVLYTVIFFFLAFLLSSFLYYRLHHNLLKQVSSMLSDEADELIDEINEEINEEIDTSSSIAKGCELFATDIAERKNFPIYFRVIFSSGKQVFRSENSRFLAFPDKDKKINNDLYKMNNQLTLLLYKEKYFIPALQKKLIVQMGTNVNRIEKIASNLLENIFTAMPIMLILCIGGGMIASRKTRAIIRDITEVTQKITSQNLKERLKIPPVNDEIQELTLTINSMMDRLETSFGEIKQFTSDVSHELRNPLFALKGEIEVTLSQKRKEYEYRESMQVCLERINVLIKMVNDLFLITRFDSNKIHLEFEYINLGDMIRDMHDFFLPMTQQKQIDFTISRCDETIICVDKIKICQVVNNLIENAVKFTPQNGTIDISLMEKNKNAIALTVTDNGVGMSSNELEKIFDRFYQIDRSRSGAEPGAGLGLHICKKIVEAHEGTIKVKQNADKGVVFIVHLPILSL